MINQFQQGYNEENKYNPDLDKTKRSIEPLSKDDFASQITKVICIDIKEHILGNIFRFQGYHAKIFEPMKYYLETLESSQKQSVGGELIIAVYKIFKHAVNNCWPGKKFLKEFKVPSKLEEDALFLVNKPLQEISSSENTSFIVKIQRINSVLPWVLQYLIYFPSFEDTLYKEVFILGLLRFVNYLLQHVRKNIHLEEVVTTRGLILEMTGLNIEGIIQLVYMIYKAKNYKNTTESANSETQTPAKASQTHTKEATKEEKTECVSLLIGILRESEQLSQQQGRSLILEKNRICLYVKLVKQIVDKDIESAQIFVEKGGLKKIIQHKLSCREIKKGDFVREFIDLVINLTKDAELDLVNLECQIKALFWHTPTHKLKLRVFAEKFSEQFASNSEETLKIIKRLCKIEDNKTQKKITRKRPGFVHEERVLEEKQEEGRIEDASIMPTIEEIWEGRRRFRDPRENEEIKEETKESREAREEREKKQNLLVFLKPDVEFSYIYTLDNNLETQIREENEPMITEGEKNKGDKIHIIDYKPPSKAQNVVKALIEGIVEQMNWEIMEEENSIEKGKTGKFYYLFTYDVLLQTIQALLAKYPILTHNTLRHNVTSLCTSAPKDSYIELLMKEQGHMTFMKYFLRILVFCTLDLFKSFLLGIFSRTTLIIEKGKVNNTYPSPYFYLLKRQIVKEIYQILQEQIGKGAEWLSKTENVRLFCGISGILLNILPFKDVAKGIWENIGQEDFINIYSEALKQAQASHREGINRVMPYIVEPLSVLVQYNWHFTTKKDSEDETEIKVYDIWMPKEALGNTNSFAEDWRSLVNVGAKRQENRRTSIFRFVDPSEGSDSSQEEGLFSFSEEDMAEDLLISEIPEEEVSILEQEEQELQEGNLEERSEEIRWSGRRRESINEEEGLHIRGERIWSMTGEEQEIMEEEKVRNNENKTIENEAVRRLVSNLLIHN